MNQLYYNEDQNLSNFVNDDYVSQCECPGYNEDVITTPLPPYIVGACLGLVLLGIAWLMEST